MPIQQDQCSAFRVTMYTKIDEVRQNDTIGCIH